MRFGYNDDYEFALRDVLCWFENHSPYFKKKEHKLIMTVMRNIYKNKVLFFRDKECYEIAEVMHDKKV